MGEPALDDPAAGVHPVLAPVRAAYLVLEHGRRPSVEAVLDDPEGRLERRGESIGAPDVFKVVVARAVVSGVRERRRLRPGLAGEVAQPEHALAGEMPDGRPQRPPFGRRM